ncbi:MAG: hypothetical protein ABMB14_17920 [Myxococcota bacterium]
MNLAGFATSVSPLLRTVGSVLLAPVLLAPVLLAAGIAFAEAPSAAPPSAAPKATRADYALDVSRTTAAVKVGQPGTLSVTFVPKNGTKLNLQAPLAVTVRPNPAVAVDDAALDLANVRDPAAHDVEVTTGVRGLTAGQTVVALDVSFYLCTDAWCQRMTDAVSVPIDVAP